MRYAGITTSFRNQYEEYESIMRREKLDFIQIDYALDNLNAARGCIPDVRMRERIVSYWDQLG